MFANAVDIFFHLRNTVLKSFKILKQKMANHNHRVMLLTVFGYTLNTLFIMNT